MTDSPIAPILGRVPSGVFILTVRHGDEETGMLSSWVMQAGFEPPMLSIAIRQSRYFSAWLDAGAPLVLNVLGEGTHRLMRHFAKGFEPGQDAFDGLEISRSRRGVPILADAIGYLECTPTAHLDSGDHRVYLATIDDGRLLKDLPPMVHVRKTGLHY